jgi:hypothetical protein
MELSVYCRAFILSSDGRGDLPQFRVKAVVRIGRIDTEGTTLHTSACPSTAIICQKFNSYLLSIDFTYDNKSQFRNTDVRT